ncbi:hypothetical protein JZO67_003861 [Enterococcus sp. 665A]|uniref:Uncharacterized protein n=1 Tax=Candidatus Enterococcus ferrettii TaxID=2815324 RepID=A0ABV0EWD8_9ENTE
MTSFNFFKEYLGLLALTFVFFIMNSTNYLAFLPIALIELPITIVFFLLRKNRQKSNCFSDK